MPLLRTPSRKRTSAQTHSPSPEKRVRAQTDGHLISDVWSAHASQEEAGIIKSPQDIVREARIATWTETGHWPTSDKQVATDRAPMDISSLDTLIWRSTRRTRSNFTLDSAAETSQTSTATRERAQKLVTYNSDSYEIGMHTRGSFMTDHREGISRNSEELLARLLQVRRDPPANTLFTDENVFQRSLDSLTGENEAKVNDRIARLIFPSAEVLALHGSQHLEVIKETINASWSNAISFHGPLPQPDFSLGFSIMSLPSDRLKKIEPMIGSAYQGSSSYIAPTFSMFLPFFTSEVKQSSVPLKVADRQNLHSQTVALRGLVALFRNVGLLQDLHRDINGFSISHNHEKVFIWGHYIYVTGNTFTFHRHLIIGFSIDVDHRWTAWNFVRNVYDDWVPGHYQKICAAIDLLPDEWPLETLHLAEA